MLPQKLTFRARILEPNNGLDCPFCGVRATSTSNCRKHYGSCPSLGAAVAALEYQLDQEIATSAGLRGQLTTQHGTLTSLQAQLTAHAATSTSLRNQLAAESATSEALRAQLAAESATSEGLRAQLAAEHDLSELRRGQLEAEQVASEDLRRKHAAEVASLNAKLEAKPTDNDLQAKVDALLKERDAATEKLATFIEALGPVLALMKKEGDGTEEAQDAGGAGAAFSSQP